MKLSKMMIAVATLAAAGSAFADAASVAYVTGASATKANQKTALTNLCTAAGGTFSSPSYMSTGSNVSTYVCATAGIANSTAYNAAVTNQTFVKFAGTDYTEVRLNVAGGSFTALQGLAGQLYADDAAAAAAGVSANDRGFINPAFEAGTSGYKVFSTTSIGGLTDLDAEASLVANPFPEAAVADVGIAQTFGVAVSPSLYAAMFTKQLGTTVATGCAVTDTAKPECVPSISKAQMASIMSGNEFADAKTKGAEFLGAPAGTELKYYRRVDTSGTQAAAQVYFLNAPCSAGALGVISEPTSDDEAGGLKDQAIGSLYRVYAAPGTGDVRTGLSSSTAYAIGVISGENNGGSGQTWKWVRVQGAAIAENAVPGSAGITNKATAAAGTYDFFFESKAYYDGNDTSAGNFFAALSTALTTLVQPVGLETTATLGYSRGGLACTPVSK
jgi:hypothetical protein